MQLGGTSLLFILLRMYVMAILVSLNIWSDSSEEAMSLGGLGGKA